MFLGEILTNANANAEKINYVKNRAKLRAYTSASAWLISFTREWTCKKVPMNNKTEIFMLNTTLELDLILIYMARFIKLRSK